MTRRPEPPSRERQDQRDRLADDGGQPVEESEAQRERLAQVAAERPWAIRVLVADRWADSPPAFARAVIVIRTMLTERGIAPRQIAALLAAPCDPICPAQIEQWRVLGIGQETFLFGRVTGHPTVPDGHRALSTCVVGGPTEDRLMLTFSGQLYRLGQRSSRPPDDAAIDAIARILAETSRAPDEHRDGGRMRDGLLRAPRLGEGGERRRGAGEGRLRRDRPAPAQTSQPIASEPAVPPPVEAAPTDRAADTPQEVPS